MGSPADHCDDRRTGDARAGDDSGTVSGTEHHIAALLQAAADEAARLRAEAESDADAVTTRARLLADDLERQARDALDKAKAVLVRARDRSDRMLAKAEDEAARAATEAELRARARVAEVVDAGQARLRRLTAEEHRTRQGLVAARNDLQQLVERLAADGDVIDLTEPEPRRPLADPSRLRRSGSPAATDEVDPLAEMVRAAVERAAESSRPVFDG